MQIQVWYKELDLSFFAIWIWSFRFFDPIDTSYHCSLFSQKRRRIRHRANMVKPALPRVIFGTGSLGNLYTEPPYEDKKAVVEAIVKSAGDGVAVFDSAGKYGAGLALEVIGQVVTQ